jgi:predicted amidohydrolase
LRAALVQLRSGRDPARNIDELAEFLREARAQGAEFAATPEMTNVLEPDRARLRSLIETEERDEGVARLARLAADLGIWLNVGSMALTGGDGRLVNRSLLFSPDGRIVARYDKIHLFDVDLPTGERLRESEAYAPGTDLVTAALPWCRIGMTVCYDLRFPALFAALAQAGAQVITVPSAFTVPTGEAHWHVLLRARAIETGSYVLAAAQGGAHESGRRTYGHSLAVSPWGEVLAEAGTEPCLLIVDIDAGEAERARRRIPALGHQRGFRLKDAPPVAT